MDKKYYTSKLKKFKIKNVEDAYKQNKIVCDKMKEIAKKYGCSRRLTHQNRLTKIRQLNKKGQVSGQQLSRMERKFIIHQYCQGFIDGVRSSDTGGTKE